MPERPAKASRPVPEGKDEKEEERKGIADAVRAAARAVRERPRAEARSSSQSAGKQAATRKPRSKKASRRERQDAARDFIIAYDGRFLGHYRSAKRITNRTAFQHVVRQLNPSIEDFDIAKLRLYRPVPIDVEPPGSLEEMTDGSFEWFSKTESIEDIM